MAGCVRVVVLVAMMLASWASGTWAATCSDATSLISIGTVTGNFVSGTRLSAFGQLPLSVVAGDRITNVRAVWRLNEGKTIAGSLGLLARYGSPGVNFVSPGQTGLNSGTINSATEPAGGQIQPFEAPGTFATMEVVLNADAQASVSPTAPAATTTTILSAEIFVQCVPVSQSTTTTVSSNPNPSTPGQAVILTANVSAASGTPTGTVEFFDDGTSLGSRSFTI
jgi:hypothetical protein